ncbi:zf-HC2 domain-containing protein [Echinicola strongylocentroti]|nr:zf-HC2 domain-containing protein [Echinicola strongylocentroti]
MTTKLVEKERITQLNLREKLQMRMHLFMCTACKAYIRQSKALERIISNWAQSSKTPTRTFTLSDNAKKEIIKKIAASD